MSAPLEEKMIFLFDTAYYIAKCELPMTNFVQACKLQSKHGLNLVETYMNNHRCRNFIEEISRVLRSDLRDCLNSLSPRFFSVMADRATDLSVTEEEIVYVRYSQPVCECSRS